MRVRATYKSPLLLLLWLAMSPVTWAIDAYQKIARDPPEALDLSKTVRSSGGFFSATYDIAHTCAPLNTIHSWNLTLTDRTGLPLSGAEINVSADMPEHLHGMTTRPQAFEVCGLKVSHAKQSKVTSDSTPSESSFPGEYRIDGMNFHMPGWWEVTLDVSRGGGRDLARFNVLVGGGYCHD